MKKTIFIFLIMFFFSCNEDIQKNTYTIQYQITTDIPVSANIEWKINNDYEYSQINGTKILSPKFVVDDDTSYFIQIYGTYEFDFSGNFYIMSDGEIKINHLFNVVDPYPDTEYVQYVADWFWYSTMD